MTVGINIHIGKWLKRCFEDDTLILKASFLFAPKTQSVLAGVSNLSISRRTS